LSPQNTRKLGAADALGSLRFEQGVFTANAIAHQLARQLDLARHRRLRRLRLDAQARQKHLGNVAFHGGADVALAVGLVA
jgi:hypothetical protein